MASDKHGDRDRQIIDVTFNATPDEHNPGWGWRIPRNPQRQPGKFTEEELEVSRLAENRTPQAREAWRTKTHAYWAPFNYPNVQVDLGRPGTGVEFNPDGAELDIYPYGAITIQEQEPIVAATVIGSGCSSMGYVILEAEPLEWKYPRTMVRMIRRDLWGVHVRGDAWAAGIDETWNDAGLSCARFDIPDSGKVVVGGWSHGADQHYCIRIVRVELKEAL